MRLEYKIFFLLIFINFNLFSQVSNKIEILDYFIEDQDLVFIVNQNKIFDDNEKYKIDLSYRIIYQDRSTSTRNRLNDYNKVFLTLSDTPFINPGQNSFKVNIDKYLTELIGSDGSFDFRVESSLHEISLNITEKDISAKKNEVFIKGYTQDLISKYQKYDPSLGFNFEIRGPQNYNYKGQIIEENSKISTGSIPELTKKNQYTFYLLSSKYGENIQSQAFKVKSGSAAKVIGALILIGGGAYFGTSSSGNLKANPPLPEPPLPGGN